AAFFEVFGAEGWTVLKQVVESIKEESDKQGSHIPVVLDAKRGDIASTAEAYADSAFESLGVDCITLSPYLGKDSIDPFIKNSEKGVFVLCKTSNAGSGDLQDVFMTVDGGQETVNGQRSMVIPLYLHVAQLANSWNIKNNIGLVVGATHLDAMKKIREVVPNMWFLAPGVGTQGGNLESAMRVGLR
ncbi:MAG: orotidine-5'-phosphate decarboxylase, partial [Anaerolineales bacterium]|nr:orotidine-5'-phosphate decarboxylase [Anaerolineales bacterium]